MFSEDTLKVRNLPRELSDAEKEDFMNHFGAQKVKIITSTSKQKSVVYAKFESKDVAKSVLNRLHQATVLNCRLCVEYADVEIGPARSKCRAIDDSASSHVEFFNNFITKINAFNNSVNYNQPPPAHLKYSYPKANRATISNIAHALATVPKFYTQVLHLMNKMNLPPPFVIEDPSQLPPRLAQEAQKVLPPTTNHNPQPQSSSESELESDDDTRSKNTSNVMPRKRTLPHTKPVKRPKFIKPNIALTTVSQSKPADKTEDVFDKVNVSAQKKIEVKVGSDSLKQPATAACKEVVGTIGVRSPEHKATDPATGESKEDSSSKDASDVGEPSYISESELASNQIPLRDLGVLPVFKDYHPGAPSCRLYIKNIAKNVTAKDLHFIYGRYRTVEDSEEKPSQFDIRLMQEGRMKGQAFVTLDSVVCAQKALKETNGFILKEKPLVVVFARSAASKK